MNKRKMPSYLERILSFDKYITEKTCKILDQFMIIRSFKRQMKTLEYSCHGLVWLTCWLLFIWFFWIKSLFQMQVNFFLGLVLDIIFVAVLKAIFRRRRPIGNKRDSFEIGPDKYSFPSGHVSRAVFIAYFFIYLYPINTIFVPPLYAWCFSVAISRILLRRHHLLDVVAGSFLGIIEGLLLSYLWLSSNLTFYLIEWITDERLEGGEYHV